MSWIRGLLATIVTFLLVGTLLSMLLHAALPGEFDAQGHLTGRNGLLLAVLAQAVSAFAAGAVALRHAAGRWQKATATMGSALFVLLALATGLAWSQAPSWFNALSLAMTLPFVALGAAWRQRRLRDGHG